MASEVTLPALGESVTEGTVTRWLKQVGDTVAVDEPLLEVSTDKVDTEIPSPVAGTLLEIRANEDDTVEVGAVLAVVGDEGEGGGSGDSEQASEEPAAQEEPAQEAPAEPAQEAPAEPAEEPAAAQEEAPAEAAPAAQSGSGDATSVTLPALGESVTEGTVTRWLKQVGDSVAVDEPLLEVSTDKVDTEIPSPVAGTLLEIKVSEDETVEVGAELALVGSGQPAAAEPEAPQAAPTEEPEQEEAPAAPAQEAPKQEEAPKEQPRQEAPTQQAPQQDAPKQEEAPAAKPSRDDDQSAYVTPLVRKLAADKGVDLSTLTGTGVGGRIRKQDVLDAAAAASAPAEPEAPAAESGQAATPAASSPSVTPSPLRGRTEPLSRLRKVIASRMVESLQTAAQLTTVIEVDVTEIARQRDAVKAEFAEREGVKLSFMPFFAKASIDTLKAHPTLNAAIDMEKGEVTYFDRENLAVAVDTEKGLLTPVIKDAGDLSIAGLARKIADVAERTRTNKITPDELSGGTFTLTNTGSRGALFDTPIINQPQVAILGTGAVVKRPVVIDDPKLGETIAVRHMVYLALTYDHRLVDGADAARFLSDVKERLEAGGFDI
ncbi:2-oxoglutarate dehydrogenase, E2 component, dihydrolipoamide succinyltransferase [Nocardioides sp. Y6]|uniref:Dihydrolipoamide acetyltransferase component of pyruvate dehydrogenase complex n=1 Tax=Nocardioides malaquae TaxID=2773426 RepID=A0ABR9RVP5_9ACTN|nr:2-oxoglutarate dehydrogenase, E2 component, dihydrolipoamide succinyltransferase [Nocardioides malaquae]MBE7325669.1 2-oxoglutarate dehydrogenase, E2 component, dihydrolipoamide succinyltransferase [Nocardioides malaquae]